MTAKQITDISISLEKLGFEVIKIKERKGNSDFPHIPALIKFIITPAEPKENTSSELQN
jgi:hypothetical protein